MTTMDIDITDDMPTVDELCAAGIDLDLMSIITMQLYKGNLSRNQVKAIFKEWLQRKQS